MAKVRITIEVKERLNDSEGPTAKPANQVLLDYSTTKGGVNGGGGISMRLGRSRARMYLEARYHQMYTKRVTTFLPVTVGFRW